MSLMIKKIKQQSYLITIVCLMIAILTLSVKNIIQSDILNLVSKHNKEYSILIYIEDKMLYLFEDDICIKNYSIATGKPSTPSPIGQWKIIEKSQWGEGFGGRWLGLNVFWGTFGIHGTLKESSIGHAVSHGCIRLRNIDIKELYNLVPIGTTVTIIGGSFGPFGSGFRDLVPGDSGADVLAVQRRLKSLGYYNGKESGIYNEELRYALKKFQRDNKLNVKVTITYEDYYAMGFREFD